MTITKALQPHRKPSQITFLLRKRAFLRKNCLNPSLEFSQGFIKIEEAVI